MKILIIRFSSIGDIVLTTPVIRCVKKKYPNADLHYLTKSAYASILSANPYISRLHLFDKDINQILPELKAQKFDLVIDLHKNIRSTLVKRSLGIKSFTFKKLNFEKWIKVNFGVNMLPQKHIVDRYFEALLPLGVEDDGQGLDFYIRENEVYESTIQMAKSPYVAFVLGAKHNTKKLPESKVLEICGQITGRIVLLGGKEEAELGEKINTAMPAKVVNMCGKLSLNESAYLIKNARKVIAHDTGLMHIAAAFKKPIISIWGSTIPAFGMYPYFGHKYDTAFQKNVRIMEVDGLPCRPCSKIGHQQCPKEHFNCMNGQDAEKIALLANQV